MTFIVRGVPQLVADEVRRTRRSPGYGHPAHQELATGTGPCRCCLRPFVPGKEQRLLFTYRPPAQDGTLTAPGPVFIHADHCEAWNGDGFPGALVALPLAFEARASHGRVTALRAGDPRTPESQVSELLGLEGTSWLHVRHAEAGCFIARVLRQ